MLQAFFVMKTKKALSHLKGQGERYGFTLIEIMIVVGIIALLLSIAIPYFITYRASARTKACVANLRQIEAAKEQWALEQRRSSGPCPIDEIIGSDKYIKATPFCGAGGGAPYIIGDVGVQPQCPTPSVTDHKLPQ